VTIEGIGQISDKQHWAR